MMTANELIKVLQEFDGNCEVYFEDYAKGTYHSFQDVIIDQQGVLGDVILTNYTETKEQC